MESKKVKGFQCWPMEASLTGSGKMGSRMGLARILQLIILENKLSKVSGKKVSLWLNLKIDYIN